MGKRHDPKLRAPMGSRLPVPGDHKTINKVAGGKSRAQRSEGMQKVHEFRAILHRNFPQRFVLDDASAPYFFAR
jgi:hypothetical protein